MAGVGGRGNRSGRWGCLGPEYQGGKGVRDLSENSTGSLIFAETCVVEKRRVGYVVSDYFLGWTVLQKLFSPLNLSET